METLVAAVPAILVIAFVLAFVMLVRTWYLTRPRRRQPGRSIRVIGVGGAGSRILNDLVPRARAAELISCNTDLESLRAAAAPQKLQIGTHVTNGLGTGGDPTVGQRAAKEDETAVSRAIGGSDIVLVVAGLGGGTGSGAAPVIARLARDAGALTIGVVTKPFSFEGTRRTVVAADAAAELRSQVDTLITIKNDRVRDIVPPNSTMLDAFALVDDAVQQTIQAIVDLPAVPGFISIGLADVRAVMKDGGTAVIGVGRAEGSNRAVDAARQAISAQLLDDSIEGATRVLMNVRGSSNLRLDDVTDAADVIRAAVDPDAHLVFGANIDESLGDQIVVTVIATGIRVREPARPTVFGVGTAAASTNSRNGRGEDEESDELESDEGVAGWSGAEAELTTEP